MIVTIQNRVKKLESLSKSCEKDEYEIRVSQMTEQELEAELERLIREDGYTGPMSAFDDDLYHELLEQDLLDNGCRGQTYMDQLQRDFEAGMLITHE